MEDIRELFTCQRCGRCCRGETTVSLDADDQERLSRFLAMEEEKLFRKYLRRKEKSVQMRVVDGHCIFYEKGCAVHGGRPWRCAQWPLHPAILLDENNFTTIKNSCAGMNRELSYEAFRRKLSRVLSQSAPDSSLPPSSPPQNIKK